MKYFQSIGGYYYKEYKNGKKVRISRKVYEKKMKTQKGGDPTYREHFLGLMNKMQIFKNLQKTIKEKCPYLSLTYVSNLQQIKTHHRKKDIEKIQERNKIMIGKVCLSDTRPQYERVRYPETDINGGKCIAYIYINETANETILENISVEINSYNEPQYDGKKYNKLLRAIIFIIIYKLKNYLKVLNNHGHKYTNIKYMYSFAINPISAWLMMSIFKYDEKLFRENNEEFRKFQEKKQNLSLKEKIFTYMPLDVNGDYNTDKNLVIHVPITMENYKLANALFSKLTEKINTQDAAKCPEFDTPMSKRYKKSIKDDDELWGVEDDEKTCLNCTIMG